MIKKTITISFLAVLILGSITPMVKAVSEPIFGEDLPTSNNQNFNQTDEIRIKAGDVPNIINKIARWLYAIVLALSTVFGLYAAFLYLTGNPKNVEKAKKQLVYAVVGVAIAIVAFSIEAIIRGIIR